MRQGVSGPSCNHGPGGEPFEPVDDCPEICRRCNHPCPWHWAAIGCDSCGCKGYLSGVPTEPR